LLVSGQDHTILPGLTLRVPIYFRSIKMIIQCTSCKARFKIPDGKMQKEEMKARCAKCGQIFSAKAGVNAFTESQEPALESVTVEVADRLEAVAEPPVKKEVNDIFDEPALFDAGELSIDTVEPPASPEPPKPKPPEIQPGEGETEIKATKDNGFPESDTERIGKDIALALDGKPTFGDVKKEPAKSEVKPQMVPEKAAKTKIIKKEPMGLFQISLLYFATVLVSLILGLLFMGLKFPFKDLSLLYSSVPDSIKPGLTITGIGSDYVRTFAGEPLFVINGKAFNNSERTLKGIKFEAELYSKGKRFIKKEKFPCCLSLSRKVLHDIKDLNSVQLIYERDRVDEVRPYQKLPFTLVFKKPQDRIESLRVNILDE